MSQVYEFATCDVPDGCLYLSNGKYYREIDSGNDDGGSYFIICDDTLRLRKIRPEKCRHLLGGKWYGRAFAGHFKGCDNG